MALVVHVEVHGFTCSTDILGTHLILERGERRFRVDFPESEDAFEFLHAGRPAVRGSTPDPRDYSPQVALVRAGSDLVQIRLIRIVVKAPSELSAATFDPSQPDQQIEHDRLLHALIQEAESVAIDLSDRVRLNFNPWLEPTGTFPRIVSDASLVDLDADLTFGQSLLKAGAFRVVSEDQVVRAGDLPKLKFELESGPVPAAELLLSDAGYWLQTEQVSAPALATLLAAVALETRVGRYAQTKVASGVLRGKRKGGRGQSFHNQLVEIVKAERGIAPRSFEQQLLARVQVLFERRNAIAHHGANVTKLDATEHVKTAHDAFALMDSL